jgi:hypothetical protein
MTVYTAECAIDPADTITATRSSNRVELEPSGRVEVYLDPADARIFARGILALADEVDGGEVAEAATPETRALQVGDRVRVVKDDPDTRAGEFVGKVGTLTAADPRSGSALPYVVAFGDGTGRHGDAVNGKWCVADVKLVEEPAEPATTPEPISVVSLRGDLVTQAKTLLADVMHTSAADVIDLAKFLAAE